MDAIISPANSPAARPAAPTTAPTVRGWAVWLVAAAAFGVELAVSGRYGYVRDELYFLAAGRHLAAGYVDQPALTPLLTRLDVLVTGNTLVGLRALPALGLAALVLLTAAMARTLGAGRGGQLLAALATACCAEYLGAMHELTTTPVDFVCWAVVLLLVVKLLASGDPRWWPAIGAGAGAGMADKWNIGFLVAGLVLGFVVTPAVRPLLRSRYVVIGGLLFAVLAAPDFVWQALHGWPNLAVFRQLQRDAWQNRVMYWPGQILYTSIVLVPLWAGGLVRALRDTRLRALGVAAAAVILAQFVLGGKTYYPGGVYTFLFAAGAVALGERPLRWRVAVCCAAGTVSTLISLPVLPAAALARFPVQKINYDLGEEIGWPSQVALLARAYRSLPSSERAVAAVITGNYGEAGAVDRYGASFGLPQVYGGVYSGANNYWLWGPPPARDTAAVAINVDPELLRRSFAHVRVVAVYRNGLGVADDEEGAVVYVATGLRGSWASVWAAFRDYS
jgi:hypothetical protein